MGVSGPRWFRIMWISGPRWLRRKRTSGPGWFRNKRSSGPGLLSRWTPPSGRSSLRWVRPISWGFFLGFSPPLPVLVLVPHAQWVKNSLPSCNQGWMPQQTTAIQNSRTPLPKQLWVAQHIELGLHLQFFPCQISWPLVLQLGTHLLYSQSVPNTRNGTASLATYLNIKMARWSVLALMKPASAVGAALHLSSQLLATAPDNLSQSSPISPPVWSRLPQTLITDWL